MVETGGVVDHSGTVLDRRLAAKRDQCFGSLACLFSFVFDGNNVTEHYGLARRCLVDGERWSRERWVETGRRLDNDVGARRRTTTTFDESERTYLAAHFAYSTYGLELSFPFLFAID
jgi:hypothetical protein